MSPERQHTVILVPGLGDDSRLAQSLLEHATAHWSDWGLSVLLHPVFWRDGAAFKPKLHGLLAEVEKAAKVGKVSVAGVSAGGSLAFNAYMERPDLIHKAVSVCGRLRTGKHHWRSLARMARTSRAFSQSVVNFERKEPKISQPDRKRMMTTRPFFGDELVPRNTADLTGAHNHWVYTPEHMLGIYLSLRLTKPVLEFLASE